MKQDIILLFGGESNERFVSVASAQAMAKCIADSILWFWHKDGQIYNVSAQELAAHKNPFTQEFIPTTKALFPDIETAILSKKDTHKVFVLGLHGTKGEDGYIQSLLEKYHQCYTGADAKISKIAFDKIKTKEALAGQVHMAPHISLQFENEAITGKALTNFFNVHGPFIVKLAQSGSSFGLTFVKSFDKIPFALQELKKNPQERYIVEKIIQGREFTVGVIQTKDDIIALPATEIILQNGQDFDYEGKYLGKGSQEITPANISPKLMLLIQKTAIKAHQGLKVFGYSRTDMIYNEHDGLFFIEINTLPGMTTASLVPQQLAVKNISMKDFLRQQIELATKRIF